MNIYEPRPGMYRYRYLPGFAGFLLQNHLEEFVKDQLEFSRSVDLPLLRHLSHLSDQQIIEFGKQSSREYLSYLAENKAAEQLRISLQRWLNDQLAIVGKFEIAAEDITVLNYMRGKLFKKWVRKYDIPAEEKFELIDEIDTMLFGATTTATNLFISMLKGAVEKESHFNKQLVTTSPGIIFIFDILNNKEVFINGNVKEVMGFTPEEVMAMESNMLGTLTHPDDLPVLKKHFEEISRAPEGVASKVEYRFRHRDGNYRWLRTYDTVFKRDANGKPIELLGTTFEITPERETASALEKRESQLLEAQALAQLGSFEWDIERDESVNTPELKNIFEFHEGYHLKEFMDHIHPMDRERVEREISQSLITGNLDSQYRYTNKVKEKVLWTRGAVVFRDNKPVLIRGTVQDITQLKKIEGELLEKTRELEKSNESLLQFASVASHDLKEPLRKMSMYTDMVLTTEEESLTEHSQVNLEKVKASAIRMQNMIDDILNFSTISNNETKKRISLTAVLEDAKEILQESIAEKNVSIVNDALPDARVIPSQMRQVFQNLISNAIKFAKPGVEPRINITHRLVPVGENTGTNLNQATQYLELKISDNGIGFKQEHAQKIFGLFTRLHSRSAYDGTGLGLSICRRIIENHDGFITAESSPGQGSVFKILIPA